MIFYLVMTVLVMSKASFNFIFTLSHQFFSVPEKMRVPFGTGLVYYVFVLVDF